MWLIAFITPILVGLVAGSPNLPHYLQGAAMGLGIGASYLLGIARGETRK